MNPLPAAPSRDKAAFAAGIDEAIAIGELPAAIGLAHERLKLDPADPASFRTLAEVYRKAGRFELASFAISQAMQLGSDRADGLAELGLLQAELGNVAESERCLREALAITPDRARTLMRACRAVSGLSRTHEQITAQREQLERFLAELESKAFTLDPDAPGLYAPNINFACHGLDELPWLRRYAAVVARTLKNPAIHVRPRAGSKIRVGFLSHHFAEQHAVEIVTRGWVEQLDRSRFEVWTFTDNNPRHRAHERIRAASDHFVQLDHSVSAARDAIAAAQLDVLIYADLGMDTLSYFLSFYRLAPVQCCLWGRPVTTGVPTIDWYISSALVEPEDGDSHYSERLLKLSLMPAYYYPLQLAPLPSREALGFPADAHVYSCPQASQKLHPDFDAILSGILDADPKALIVLKEPQSPDWRTHLIQRWRAAFGEGVSRLRFLPGGDYATFLGYMARADVVLDPLHYGMGNTAFEAMALGAPVVTLPGRYQRGRFVLGCYTQIGVMDTVATSVEDYVRKAVRIASNPSYRAALRGNIAQHSGLLFARERIVREFEHFLEDAVRQRDVS